MHRYYVNNTVNIFLCVYIFMNLQKVTISHGVKIAFLIVLPICRIIKVIFKLHIFSQIFEKCKHTQKYEQRKDFYIHSISECLE